MGKTLPTYDFIAVKPEEASLKKLLLMLRKYYEQMSRIINGQLGFGDGTNADNIDGVWITVVTPGAANTDFTVTHNLQRIPVGYLVMTKDRACDIYTGSVASTKTQLTLKATTTSAVLTIFVL